MDIVGVVLVERSGKDFLLRGRMGAERTLAPGNQSVLNVGARVLAGRYLLEEVLVHNSLGRDRCAF